MRLPHIHGDHFNLCLSNIIYYSTSASGGAGNTLRTLERAVSSQADLVWPVICGMSIVMVSYLTPPIEMTTMTRHPLSWSEQKCQSYETSNKRRRQLTTNGPPLTVVQSAFSCYDGRPYTHGNDVTEPPLTPPFSLAAALKIHFLCLAWQGRPEGRCQGRPPKIVYDLIRADQGRRPSQTNVFVNTSVKKAPLGLTTGRCRCTRPPAARDCLTCTCVLLLVRCWLQRSRRSSHAALRH